MPQLVALRQHRTAGLGQAVLVLGGHLMAEVQVFRVKVTLAGRGRVPQALGVEECQEAAAVEREQWGRVAVQLHRRVEMGELGGQTTTELEAILLTPQAAAGALFILGMGLTKLQPQAQEPQAFQAMATGIKPPIRI